MNQVTLKAIICLTLMIVLLIMALTTADIINIKLCASFGIIVGAITSHHLSNQNISHYDKKRKT